jgi:lactate dehydrogenase-like 2-hydroxyacid dehydrogenase
MKTESISERPHLLQIGALLPILEDWLRERYVVSVLGDALDPAAFLAEQGARFAGVVTSAFYGVSAEQIAAMPNLRIISSNGVGLDRIALDARVRAASRSAIRRTCSTIASPTSPSR